MKKKLSIKAILFIAIIIAFFSCKKHQQSKTMEEEVTKMTVDGRTEQNENEEIEIISPKEFFRDSTIQLVDAEKGILRKDSICFFYDLNWDTYLVIPDSFTFEVNPEDYPYPNIELIAENERIKTWVQLRDKELWNGSGKLKKGLIEDGFTIVDEKMTDSTYVISTNAQKGDISFFSYLKIVSLSDSMDAFITYRALSGYKRDEIIKNVIERFPDKPFPSCKKHQQSDATEEEVTKMAVDRIMERMEQEKNDRMLQYVREYLNDSTIQIVDYEQSILRKDSICFFYDTKWDTYLVIPDSFYLAIAVDYSSMSLISESENEKIKLWVTPRNAEIWDGSKKLENSLIEAGFTIEENKLTDSTFVISGHKNGDISHYSYMKVIAFSDSIDLFIAYRALSEYKQDAIIRNVIEQFPDRPF